jgi:phenylpropionate dioxygenase-like ring-hydroxylating dioxygenase large terminal subunit
MIDIDPSLLDHWHVVAKESEITDRAPVPANIGGVSLVLWRHGSTIGATTSRCVHRGGDLGAGEVVAGELACPYHGWRFDTAGVCRHVPSRDPGWPIPKAARIRRFQVVAHLGWVWVCLGNASTSPPDFVEWDNARFRHVQCGPYDVAAWPPRLIDNFLDVSHLPFVHPGRLGDLAHTQIADYTVARDATGVTASPIKVWQPSPDGAGSGSWVHYEYSVLSPLTARFRKTFEGEQMSILFSACPTSRGKSRVWMILSFSSESRSAQDIRQFQDVLFAEDKSIVESLSPDLLPLEAPAELAVRADRLSTEYRTWLKEIGFTYGTSSRVFS